MPSPWKRVLNDFLETYPTDAFIAQMEIMIQNFRIPSNVTTSQYTEALYTKTLAYNQMYTGYTLKYVFAERWPDLVCKSVQT